MNSSYIYTQKNQNSQEVDKSTTDPRFYTFTEIEPDNIDDINNLYFKNEEKEEFEDEEHTSKDIEDILSFLEVEGNSLIQKSELPKKFKKLKIVFRNLHFKNLFENYLNLNVHELFNSDIFSLEDKEYIKGNNEIIYTISKYIKKNVQFKVPKNLRKILEFFKMDLNHLIKTYMQKKENDKKKNSLINFLKKKRENPFEKVETNEH